MTAESSSVEIVSGEVKIKNLRDALDLMDNAESTSLVLHEQSLAAGFLT